jgi:hypothetical protein
MSEATKAPEEYLTIAELAARLKLSPATVRNKMAQGVFLPGVHYFRRPGIAPRFKWSAIEAWLEGKEGKIPMAKGYDLGVDN